MKRLISLQIKQLTKKELAYILTDAIYHPNDYTFSELKLAILSVYPDASIKTALSNNYLRVEFLLKNETVIQLNFSIESGQYLIISSGEKSTDICRLKELSYKFILEIL